LSLKLPIPSLPRLLSPGGLKITRLETPTEGYTGEWQGLTFEATLNRTRFSLGLP
jgi:hypothetical protein